MKTLPLFWPDQLFKKLSGTVLFGLCFSLSAFAQEATPLATPASTEYPGIIKTFERLIQVDGEKFKNRSDYLLKNGRIFNDPKSAKTLDLEPDFLNSVILHSPSGYIKLASMAKCRFYDAILTDLLRSAEGKIRNVLVTYVNDKGTRESSLIQKKDFLAKIVNQECPETLKLIDNYQIKNLPNTLKAVPFDMPSSREQCGTIHLAWLNNPNTAYLCQIHEYMKEARDGAGDVKDLPQRKAVAKILDQKLSLLQKDYLQNLCTHLDEEDLFCQDFLNVSFWSKVASGMESNIYVESICRQMVKSLTLSDPQIKQCIARIKKENDLCLYPGDRGHGLVPQPDCDSLSTALNHSSLRANYQDCPGTSDQHAITNIARIILNISKGDIRPFQGSCSSISLGESFEFNERFDNDENWKLEACYDDKINDKEVCYKTYFGQYGEQPQSYPLVVSKILRETRGADPSIKCRMVDSRDYNPLLLEFKSGCYIIYETNKCLMSQCAHKILFNDRTIDLIRIKNRISMDYFPSSVREERFSQQYLLTRDFKQVGRNLNNISGILSFYKKSKKGLIHGVGCAEELLPSFFKKHSMNQCSPMPFIIDGMIRENDQNIFITRTAVDSLQAPRMITWSNIYSAVKTYQRIHPLRLWTLYGLD